MEELLHGILLAAEEEEPVLLLHRFRPLPVIRAEAVHQILLGHEPLAAGAVEPGVRSLLQKTALLQAIPESDDGGPVAFGIGRTDEGVKRNVEPPEQLLEERRIPVDELLGRHPERLSCLLDLDAVLVGAHVQADLVAAQAEPPRHHVREHLLHHVPHVRSGIGKVDGRVNVLAWHD